MTLVLDSGALVALERNDRLVWSLVTEGIRLGRRLITHGGVVGQVWRGSGPRSARLVRALTSVEVLPLDDALGRRAGELLARAKKRDVIDAAIVELAAEGDSILTSDLGDLTPLAAACGRAVDLIGV